MGIQINGQTDTITAIDGGLNVSGADLGSASAGSLNVTGIVTATSFVGNLTGNINASGVSTIATLNVTQSNLTRLNVSGVSTFSTGIVVSAGTTASPSISPSGDSNTGIFFPSPDTIAFGEGGVEALRIDSNANIGIGTNNPSQKLEVVGGEIKAGRIDTGSEGGQVSFGRATDNATGWYIDAFGNTSTPSLRFVDVSNAAVRMTVDGVGRVTKPFTPHIFGSVTNTSSVSNSLANSMAVITSTELTFSNSRITVPVAGLYLITFTSISNNSSSRIDANILVNGTGYLNMLSEDTTTGFHYRSGSMTIKLAANDYIQFYNQNWYNNTSTSFDPWKTASVTFLG